MCLSQRASAQVRACACEYRVYAVIVRSPFLKPSLPPSPIRTVQPHVPSVGLRHKSPCTSRSLPPPHTSACSTVAGWIVEWGFGGGGACPGTLSRLASHHHITLHHIITSHHIVTSHHHSITSHHHIITSNHIIISLHNVTSYHHIITSLHHVYVCMHACMHHTHTNTPVPAQ